MYIIYNPGTAGLSVYAVAFNDVSQAFKPASVAFTTYTTTRSDFVVYFTEVGTTGLYYLNMLSAWNIPRINWYIYTRTGGAPSHASDVLVDKGSKNIDTNVVFWADGVADDLPGNITDIADYLTTIVTPMSANVTTIASRLGAFTGTGTNTILGFLKAMIRKDLAAPSDVGGTFDPTTDSQEAHTDGSQTVKDMSSAGMAKFVNTNTGETTAATGSVAKISQGSNDPATFLQGGDLTVSMPANSIGERLKRVPNAPPGAAGGLPTVDGSNRVVGVQAATNITSTAGPVHVDASGYADVIVNHDKTGYDLSSSAKTSIADAVAAQSLIDTLFTQIGVVSETVATPFYYAQLSFIKATSIDEYTVQWFVNNAALTSGLTSVTIEVIKRSDGTDLIAATAMTQIGTTGAYKYDASGAARLVEGDSAIIVMRATINSSVRVWRKVVGKDVVT